MATLTVGSGNRQKTRKVEAQRTEVSIDHYLALILHRKWLVLTTFVLVAAATAVVAYMLPDIYRSETVILVDPQRVPDSYVKATVTGDVRNRLTTLSQQILSATRLERIIDTMNLYPKERKTKAREDVITKMRSDIAVNMVGDGGGSQDLAAFRITYRGRDPRLVAQVANALASLFIEENLKAREEQATGTEEFLNSQLEEMRKTLETDEAKLKNFKLQHIGEMPEQQTADLQILGQMQSQMQLESDALSRAEQQRTYIESMMATSTAGPVIDMDDTEPAVSKAEKKAPKTPLELHKEQLAKLLTTFTEKYPPVQRLKRQIEVEELLQGVPPPPAPVTAHGASAASSTPASPASPANPAADPETHAAKPARPPRYVNPVLEAQLKQIDDEVAKHRVERQRLSKVVGEYQKKLEEIPVREQQITDLVRDYEISKGRYSQLLEKKLSADTATQLEIRQKGERFSILDPAQPAQRPDQPKRAVIDGVGAVGGLALGLLLALTTEFLGMSITSAEQITELVNVPVLEVIPLINTRAEKRFWKRLLILAAGAVAAGALVCGTLVLFYHIRPELF
ncbi:MAG TPA: Wzz/FepE/Etk N-terminal domain-containing protein [Bryobacteraceae bacterium]|nr:Wzz/FepE/Etk N-terminal domain-containing protein [Bryobacteraceae bacterium]